MTLWFFKLHLRNKTFLLFSKSCLTQQWHYKGSGTSCLRTFEDVLEFSFMINFPLISGVWRNKQTSILWRRCISNLKCSIRMVIRCFSLLQMKSSLSENHVFLVFLECGCMFMPFFNLWHTTCLFWKGNKRRQEIWRQMGK